MMTRKLMKLSALLAMLVAAMPLMAQKTTADQILGKWLNEDKDAHVEIYKESGKYFGKIVWLKEPIEESTGKPKLDDENSDPALQTRPIMGLIILKDFIFDGEDEWEDGTIYDPKNGKTYDCYMEIDETGILHIRGYIGISWIGRTTYWTRVN
jgi:uncharacterized protein (DUF2147 family)